jgi:putative hemolysin
MYFRLVLLWRAEVPRFQKVILSTSILLEAGAFNFVPFSHPWRSCAAPVHLTAICFYINISSGTHSRCAKNGAAEQHAKASRPDLGALVSLLNRRHY